MNKLFDTLRHNRRLAMVVTLAGTLLFTLASAARAAAGGSGWEGPVHGHIGADEKTPSLKGC